LRKKKKKKNPIFRKRGKDPRLLSDIPDERGGVKKEGRHSTIKSKER